MSSAISGAPAGFDASPRVLVVACAPGPVLDALARTGCETTVTPSVPEALGLLHADTLDFALYGADRFDADRFDADRFDVVVVSLDLPHSSDVVRAGAARQVRVVATASQASFGDAAEALRAGASDLVAVPFDPSDLVAVVVGQAGDRHRDRPQRRPQRILAVGAHPDDVELGVGATLAAHSARGDIVTILTLSHGEVGGDPVVRAAEAERSASLLGAKLILADLPDTMVPSTGETLAVIEEAVAATNPDVCYIHSANDLHQDHRAAHEACLVACRCVPTVFAFQSPSATLDFHPNLFVTVDEYLDAKLCALAAFGSQSERGYMAGDLLVAGARYWGRFGRSRFAEPFEVLRSAVILDPPDASGRAVAHVSARPTPASRSAELSEAAPL